MGDANPNPTLAWALLTLVAAATGLAGWLIEGASPANAIYQTLQLFLLNFPVDANVNPVLQVGRFAAAATTGIALIILSGRVVRDRLARRRMARLRGHTVVIGSGRTGATILKSLHRQEPDSELLAIDLSQVALDRVSHLGVHLVRGDGRSRELLRKRAGIVSARRVIVAAQEWGHGTEIAETAAAEATSAEAILTHLDDLSLSHALRRRYLTTYQGPGDVFNLHENAARALLRTYDDRLAGADRGPTHVILIGGVRLAEALVVHACFAWLASLREFPLQLTIVGEDAHERFADVVRRWPMLVDRLAACGRCEMAPMAFALEGRLTQDDLVIIDLDEPDHGVAVGAALRERFPDVRIVALGRTPTDDRATPGIEIQDLSSLAWNPNILDADSLWQLAYSLHETYRQGVLAGSSPHGVPWESLPEHIQRDNRRAVAFMLEQLARYDLDLATADRELIARPVAELSSVIDGQRREALAEEEHRRWLTDRGSPDRHAQSWNELDQEARQATLTTISTWPRLLLRLGYQIVPAPADLERLLGGAQRYCRVGEEVVARRLKEPAIWHTSDGQPLHASAGDWLLESGGSEGSEGSVWSINERSFRRTYEHVEGNRYRPVGTVEAVEVASASRVSSPEGDLIAHPGDWLVRNELQEVWVTEAERFKKRYRPA